MGDVQQKSVSSLSKGSYIVIDGAACKVTDTQTSRPGKHGHSKMRVTGVGLIDEKKRVVVMPGHDMVDVPMIDKRNAQVLSISGEKANVMDIETYETFDLVIPEELKGQLVDGCTVVYWQILDDRVMKQAKTE